MLLLLQKVVVVVVVVALNVFTHARPSRYIKPLSGRPKKKKKYICVEWVEDVFHWKRRSHVEKWMMMMTMVLVLVMMMEM